MVLKMSFYTKLVVCSQIGKLQTFEILSGLREVNGESRGHPKEINGCENNFALFFSF